VSVLAHEQGAESADAAFDQRFQRVESLLAELSRATDPLVERVAREVLGTVLELHRRGLERLLEVAAQGEGVRDTLAHDPRVSAMLLLHGLHPVPLADRVSRVLDALRERFRSKVQNVDLEVRESTAVIVRVTPMASACGSTREGLQKDISLALLSAVPDAESVLVELAEPAPALITLRLPRERNEKPSTGGAR
jgi:hypothetical protein